MRWVLELDNAREFGNALRELRKERGLNQTQLGQAIGAKNHAISALETGKNRYVRQQTLMELARALHVHTGRLLRGQRPMDTAAALPEED